jgi:hypothetical protein
MTLDLTPGAPEWCARVTASKVAGILGLSPWDSPLRTWHVMAGNLPADDGNNADAKARGHYLENGVLDWWLDQNPLRTEVQRQATFTIGDWAAATPDMLATDFDGETVLVDAKTAATDDHWTDTEPPAYYFASSLWQLACAPEAKRVHLAVLFGRPRLSFREYVIERDDALIAGLIDECRTFYDTVQAGQEPGLSDMACDYDVIRTVHPDIDRDGVVLLPDDLVTDFLTDAAHEKRAPVTKAAVLAAMGTARLAKDSLGRTVARRQPKGDAVTLVRVAPPIDLTESETAA